MKLFSLLFSIVVVLQLTDAKFTRFFESRPKSHNDAMDFCAAKGTNLMIIRSDEKMTEIMKHMEQRNIKKVWLGIRRDDYPNNPPFVWKYASVDGGQIEKAYWHVGEPNNYGKDERCVEMEIKKGQTVKDKLTWNDQTCSDRLPFYCEAVWMYTEIWLRE